MRKRQGIRKIISLLLCLCLLSGFLSEMKIEVKAGTYDGFSYLLHEDTGTVEIMGYEGEDTEITIPVTIEGKDVTSIGDGAFEGCNGLTNINISEGITSIASGAFRYCEGLAKVEVSDANKNYTSYDGCLYSKDLGEILACPGGKEKVEFPQTIRRIGYGAFGGCSSLVSINIPDEVTSIGGSAFGGCSSLVSINIPEKVTSIHGYVFSGCGSLVSVNIPKSVLSIEQGAFEDCSGLVDIDIPESVTSIGQSALKGCSSLVGINIPESVTSIGQSAFKGCSSLTNINIPVGVTSVGNYAFSRCSSLTDINMSVGLTSIGDYAFYECSSLANIIIPEDVTNIGVHVFEGCIGLAKIQVSDKNEKYASYDDCLYDKDLKNLRACPKNKASVRFPQTIIGIGYYSFEGCSSLSNIVIPESVKYIGISAFYYCSNLSNITIPESVINIEKDVFYGCSSQLTIYGIVGSTAEQYANNNDIAFQALNQSGTGNQTNQSSTGTQGNQSSLGSQSVPGVSSIPNVYPNQTGSNIQSYQPAFSPQDSSQPVATVPGTKTKNKLPKAGTTKTLSSGKYLITKSSESKKTVTYLKPSNTKKATITIPDTIKINGKTYLVTAIAPGALKNNKKVTSITIGKNVTKIGKEAFYGCSNLKLIKLRTKKLKNIGKNFLNVKNVSIKSPQGCQKKYGKLFKASLAN